MKSYIPNMGVKNFYLAENAKYFCRKKKLSIKNFDMSFKGCHLGCLLL